MLVLGVLALGCGGDDEESDGVFDYEEFPFTFEYPGTWEESDEPTVDQQLGAEADATKAVGLDDENGILVQSFTLQRAVDESNLNEAKAEIDGLLNQVEPGTTTVAGEVAGFPALTVDE